MLTKRQQVVPTPQAGMLLTTGEVAQMLKLTTAGVRWLARVDRLACEITPTGQRVYIKSDVLRLMVRRAATGVGNNRTPRESALRPTTRGHDRQNLRDHLARAYNLGIVEYDRAVARQDGRCAVCDALPKPGGRLSVDHDHQTGEVRGLLCGRCNTALGLMRDSTGLICRLAAYADKAATQRVLRQPPVIPLFPSEPWLTNDYHDPSAPAAVAKRRRRRTVTGPRAETAF